MLIEESKEGRKDGSYTRLFGNEELGSLISRIHSTSIRSGNYLEKVIEEKASTLPSVDNLINGDLEQGTYLITKKVIKKSKLKTDKEPDFLVLAISKNNCYIIDLKDGDNFDTKKASGERQALSDFQNHLSNQIPYTTSIHICCFNQLDKEVIYNSMKRKFKMKEILTGKDFCDILGISYQDIIKDRKRYQIKNIEFFKKAIANLSI